MICGAWGQGFHSASSRSIKGICRPEETTCLRFTLSTTHHQHQSLLQLFSFCLIIQFLQRHLRTVGSNSILYQFSLSISLPHHRYKSDRFLQNKSFWPSITDRQKISCYDFLCSSFDSAVYETNLARSLEIPTCRVIPYFKHYLDKLKTALSSSTNFSFTSGTIEEICAKVKTQIHP